MLGPSDVRKTFSTILKATKQHSNLTLAELLEYRLGKVDKRGNCWCPSDQDKLRSSLWGGEDFLRTYFDELPFRISTQLTEWIENAIQYLEKREQLCKTITSLEDISLGNLFFVGAYLQRENNFNKTIEDWSLMLRLDTKVLNVTNGENRVLIGLKHDRSILNSEAEIVSPHLTRSKLARIYLLEDYLSDSALLDSQDKSFIEISEFLNSIESLPAANPKAIEALNDAHMIVYGPGTQHSSLLPSYMTKGISDAIKDNSKSKKVFISNIGLDHDIQGYDFNLLIKNIDFYMNIGSTRHEVVEIEDLINHSIVNFSGDFALTNSVQSSQALSSFEISAGKWSLDNYYHDGVKVAHGLMTIASQDSHLFKNNAFLSISIVVPMLDEIQTIEKVLKDLVTFDWLKDGFVPQIIVVDGGSQDGSWEKVRNFGGIHSLQDQKGKGRGSAIRLGISKSKGDFIVTFPADAEYQISSILDVVNALIQSGSEIVFGSRSTLCSDTDARLKEIYGGKGKEYFLSKWGGFLLSLVSAIRYRKWISDPLTSIKGFKRNALSSLSMEGDGLDWDTQIIVDSSKLGKSIVEIPVEFLPRTSAEGKKTTISKGIQALWKLFSKGN
jgi:2-phospho-L-lactate transferase/gluconeogenesis factor (CofD/UPF0052 family)